jgi:hypothetical protein
VTKRLSNFRLCQLTTSSGSCLHAVLLHTHCTFHRSLAAATAPRNPNGATGNSYSKSARCRTFVSFYIQVPFNGSTSMSTDFVIDLTSASFIPLSLHRKF